MATNTFHSVSLFSNCGAGDIGYAKAGFRFDVMAELDPRRLEVCLLNHPTAVGVPGDLRKTWPMVVDEYLDISQGCPADAARSVSALPGDEFGSEPPGKEGDPDAGMKDARNLLVTVISKVARELRPRVIVVENVQAFLTRQVRHPKTKVPITASSWLIDELARDYAVFPFLTDLCDYGVPQTRKRTFLTFIRLDEPAIAILEERAATPYPTPSHSPEYEGCPITLREALAAFNLPSLDACSPETAISRVGNGLHAVPVWPDRRYDMVAAIPPHAGMGAGRTTLARTAGGWKSERMTPYVRNAAIRCCGQW